MSAIVFCAIAQAENTGHRGRKAGVTCSVIFSGVGKGEGVIDGPHPPVSMPRAIRTSRGNLQALAWLFLSGIRNNQASYCDNTAVNGKRPQGMLIKVREQPMNRKVPNQSSSKESRN